jgi:cell division cycle 14
MPKYASNTIYHFTSEDYAKAANAAYLIGAFQIITMNRTAEEAYEPFKDVKLVPFRDASYG